MRRTAISLYDSVYRVWHSTDWLTTRLSGHARASQGAFHVYTKLTDPP